MGRIISVSGARARVLLDREFSRNLTASEGVPFIGTLLAVNTGHAVVLGLISEMAVPSPSMESDQLEQRLVDVELVGELLRHADGYLSAFRRGVSIYPRLGDRVQTATQDMLRKVYMFGDYDSVTIGQLQQDPSIPAIVKVDEMLGKHFAIVGSTGSGKSCAVALILRKVLEKHENAHIMLLDPHNEYGRCFGTQAEKVRITDLSLPYWFLTFEEAVEILIGDADKYVDEVEILREIIPAAKRQYGAGGSASLLKASTPGSEKYTVDVPVPYRISDVLALINVEMGRLEKRKDVSTYQRLKARIESITSDPRYAFMFGSMSVQDNLAPVLKRLFRVPVSGKPITVLQMMGLPSEVVNVVVSVLARLAFDIAMWSEGKIAITFVCEEAHRYVPRSEAQGFEPTKRAVSRIAKEGRKYGCSLCIVSQRPGDVDPTILSQCSTLITMRLSNERDQAIVESALAESSASLTSFLPALGTRETIVFGEGVPLPSRILLSELPKEALPSGNTMKFADAWGTDHTNDGLLEAMIARWRLSDGAGRDAGDQAMLAQLESQSAPAHGTIPGDAPVAGSIEEAVQHGTAFARDAERPRSLLRKPIDDTLDVRDTAPQAMAPLGVPQSASAAPPAIGGGASGARGSAQEEWRADMLRQIAAASPAE
jgi:DNA helicase HerA-like ATPase